MNNTESYSIKKIFRRLWESPTLMTWLNLLAKSLTLVLVTPLVLTRYSEAEIALWLLIASSITLVNMADLGFSTTFIRFLSYARRGMEKEDMDVYLSKDDSFEYNAKRYEPNWKFISDIFSNMKFTYRWLTLVSLLFLSISTLLMIKPINMLESPHRGWMAWAVVVVSASLYLQGSIYNSFLQGMNKVAMAMRVAAFFGLLTVLSNFTVLLLGGDIFWLILSNQTGLLLGILGSYWLCHQVEEGIFKTFTKKAKYVASIFKFAWSSAWKSGIGVFMSFGIQQIANLIIGQQDDSLEIASFLLASMFIRQIAQFSQAPFYSKIPTLAQLYVNKEFDSIIRLSKKGMFITYWLIFFGAIGLIIFVNPILNLIGSNVEFISPKAWIFLLLGILIERYGAMHIQLYSISHKIIWHIANGVTGGLFILIFFLLFDTYNYYAFIYALIGSNVLFYSWYSAKHSYKMLKTTFWEFDSKVFFIVLIVNIIVLLFV